jgi:transposase, IS5 family
MFPLHTPLALNREHILRRSLPVANRDRINAVLAAVGYNFSLLLRWLVALLCALILMLTNDRISGQTA